MLGPLGDGTDAYTCLALPWGSRAGADLGRTSGSEDVTANVWACVINPGMLCKWEFATRHFRLRATDTPYQAGFDPPCPRRNNLLNEKVDDLDRQATTAGPTNVFMHSLK